MSITEITSTTNMIDTVFQGKTGVLASYLIRGKKTALVDPGPPVQATQIIQEFKHLVKKIDVLAVTHIHLDHSAGTWNILEKGDSPPIRMLVPKHAEDEVLSR